MNNLTQEDLKSQLKYDPNTGVFTRLSVKTNAAKIGDIAGYNRPTHDGKKYTIIKIYGFSYKAARLAWLYMNGQWPKNIIDHIDGDGTNNIYTNLRDVTLHDNCKNRRNRVDNATGACGVRWLKLYRKWNSYISVNKKVMNLGYFDNLFEAVCARKNAEKIFGYHPNHGKERPL